MATGNGDGARSCRSARGIGTEYQHGCRALHRYPHPLGQCRVRDGAVVTLILGAGLAGLSCAYHLGHEHCLLLEKAMNPFGHIAAELRDGFTWDPGPHVSFTKHEYVRRLFAESTGGDFDEYEVQTGNYYAGHWIEHPARTALHQVTEPLRSQCLEYFLASRKQQEDSQPRNYQEWLGRAFGPVFAQQFPAPYTRKYWTHEPSALVTEWVGQRVFYPKVEDVVQGATGPLGKKTHYITKVRYPRSGGYQSFAKKLARGANIRYGAEVVAVDLEQRRVFTADGRTYPYRRLINTLPLPLFVSMCIGLPETVREAAAALSCSQLLLVNARARHATKQPENWIYVYDEDLLSMRIHCVEKLTPGNAPQGWTGIQTEVYFSRHRPLKLTPDEVGARVVDELTRMGLVDPAACTEADAIAHHTRYCPWADVIFTTETRSALDIIWAWFETKGLGREADDLHPLTDWDTMPRPDPSATLLMAGRFGQWKYFWTDDCVLRGRHMAELRSFHDSGVGADCSTGSWA